MCVTEVAWGCWTTHMEALVSSWTFCLPVGYKLLSDQPEAWLEKCWLRGMTHAWNTYQGPSGRRIGKKVVKAYNKMGDTFKKRSYGAFSLLPQVSRNLTYNGYLFWPFSESFKPILYQNLEELAKGRILIVKTWGWLAGSILLEFPPGAQ